MRHTWLPTDCKSIIISTSDMETIDQRRCHSEEKCGLRGNDVWFHKQPTALTLGVVLGIKQLRRE
jgi:hypothetical protein